MKNHKVSIQTEFFELPVAIVENDDGFLSFLKITLAKKTPWEAQGRERSHVSMILREKILSYGVFLKELVLPHTLQPWKDIMNN